MVCLVNSNSVYLFLNVLGKLLTNLAIVLWKNLSLEYSRIWGYSLLLSVYSSLRMLSFRLQSISHNKGNKTYLILRLNTALKTRVLCLTEREPDRK